jgi:DNA-binding MarR family transcriptional regulator
VEVNKTATVRLKLYVARQAELVRKKPKPKPREQLEDLHAAVLAAILLMDEYKAFDRLGGQEIAELLNSNPPTISSIGKALGKGKREFVTQTDDGSKTYYHITKLGIQALAQFADQILAPPSAIEAKLKGVDGYIKMTSDVEKIIDEHLQNGFRDAKKLTRLNARKGVIQGDKFEGAKTEKAPPKGGATEEPEK